MKFFNWLLSLWSDSPPNSAKKNRTSAPKILQSFEVVKAPPPNSEIPFGKFLVVMPLKEPKWALFKCPCGCDHVITLSLSKMRNPHWKVTRNRDNYPTLYPSVRQLNGCLSHFWVKNGEVYWCPDTGKKFVPTSSWD